MMWDKGGDREVYTTGTMMSLKYNCDREAAEGVPDCPDGAGGAGGGNGRG